VIYSLGEKTKKLIELLPTELLDNLTYCSRSAQKQGSYFQGKRVISPDKLLSDYIDYTIIVTSTDYGAEIFEDFSKMGINMDRCFFNTANF